MKQFEDIIEEWAMKYKPMQHVPGETSPNKRFFLFDSIVAIPSFMSNITKTNSPCVGYEFPLGGNVKGGKIIPVYTVYFFVNTGTNKPTEKKVASLANQEAMLHATKFISWLKNEQDKKERKNLQNIKLEEVPFYTYGPFLNGWYSVYIQFTDVDKFEDGCMNPEDYVK